MFKVVPSCRDDNSTRNRFGSRVVSQVVVENCFEQLSRLGGRNDGDVAGSGAIDPYVEATAGIARLTPRLSGLGPRVDPIATVGLNLLTRTDPIVGVGGGVLLRGGPVVADLGYRYKQILGNDSLTTVLSGGTNLRAHQVRFGVGLRF